MAKAATDTKPEDAPQSEPVPLPVFESRPSSLEEIGRRPFTASDSVHNIFAAFVQLQTNNRLIAEFNRKNEGFKRDGKPLGYADLTAIWEVLRPALASAHLAVTQLAHNEDRKVTVTTLVVHASGEWISSEFTMISPDGTAHKLGSTITYCKRYAMCTMLGVVSDEDDDGNAGSGVDQPPRQQGRQAAQQQAKPAQKAQQSNTPWLIISRDKTETPFADGKAWTDNWGSRIAAVLNSQKTDAEKLATIVSIYNVNEDQFSSLRELGHVKIVDEITARLGENKRRLEARVAEAGAAATAKDGEQKP